VKVKRRVFGAAWASSSIKIERNRDVLGAFTGEVEALAHVAALFAGGMHVRRFR
jgi:hypothetical protein